MRDLLADLTDDLRTQALMHPSFTPDRSESFERLEFLGDSVLDLAISAEVYRRFPDLEEGELTRIRAAVVSRESCERIARAARLGDAMLGVARAQRVPRGPAERTVDQRGPLAAVVESIIGASFRQHGYGATAARIVTIFDELIETARTAPIDPRSRLNELAARIGATVQFTEEGHEGPPHDRTFTMGVRLEASADATGADPLDATASGTGRSKQEAQHRAAAALLEHVEGECVTCT